MRNSIPSFPPFDKLRTGSPAGRRESSIIKALRSKTGNAVDSLHEDYLIDWIPACAGKTARKLQRGFSIITAIFLLVVLSFLGIAMVSFSTSQHQSSAMDVMGSRAYQAARTGIEWAAYHVANSASGVEWAGCAATTPAATLTSLGGTLSPFTVSVNCSHMAVSEVGASPTNAIWIYDVSAVACTEAVCPSAAPGANYIERIISVKMGR
jgi:MSHA biogenesis protein MshP